LYVLYFTLVSSKLEYASVVWNFITSTYANKLERIQQKFASVCFYRFLPRVPYIYTDALGKLNLQNLRKRRQDLDALSFVQVYRVFKSCASLLENISLRVPTSSLRDFNCLVFVPLINTVLLLGAPMLPIIIILSLLRCCKLSYFLLCMCCLFLHSGSLCNWSMGC
jgi:hypothetical protein